MPNLDQFTQAFIDALMWSEVDEHGEPIDRNYSVSDLAPETLARIVKDCAEFQAANGSEMANYPDSMTGHDFCLTRNHHGAGFWDGDYPEAEGKALTAAAHEFPELSLYVGDDGKLYAA